MFTLSSITPFTLIDYPNRIACVMWFAGCNLRCGYCHNHELVQGPFAKYERTKALAFLDSRIGKLDGVVFSGGECTLCPDLVEFAKEVKRRGFDLKIDTNGSRPAVVKELIEKKLVDYIALDYKAPPEKYHFVTQRDGYGIFSKTLDLLIESDVTFEVRTTVHSSQLDRADLNAIIEDLVERGYTGTYYVQNYIHRDNDTPSLIPLPKHEPVDFTTTLSSRNLSVRYRNFPKAIA